MRLVSVAGILIPLVEKGWQNAMKAFVGRLARVAVLMGALLLLPGCTLEGAQEVELVATPESTATPTPTATPEPTATPDPTVIPTLPPIPEPTPCGLLSWKESGRFTEEGVEQGEDYYKSPNISITITTISENKSEYTGRSLTGFIADIYIKDITSFRHGYAKGSFSAGGYKRLEALSKSYDAILAMSGDFCHKGKNCVVIHDGELVQDSGKYTLDLCVLYKDGTVEVYAPEDIDVEAIMAKDPWQSWNFGPILLNKKGMAAKKFNLPDSISSRNPRAALGYYEPGHYCFVCIDGRKSNYSMGLSIEEMAQFMEDLGCKVAYNLDGGLSAQIAFMGEQLNNPIDERRVRDILYIVDRVETLEAEDVETAAGAEVAETEAAE